MVGGRDSFCLFFSRWKTNRPDSNDWICQFFLPELLMLLLLFIFFIWGLNNPDFHPNSFWKQSRWSLVRVKWLTWGWTFNTLPCFFALTLRWPTQYVLRSGHSSYLSFSASYQRMPTWLRAQGTLKGLSTFAAGDHLYYMLFPRVTATATSSTGLSFSTIPPHSQW